MLWIGEKLTLSSSRVGIRCKLLIGEIGHITVSQNRVWGVIIFRDMYPDVSTLTLALVGI